MLAFHQQVAAALLLLFIAADQHSLEGQVAGGDGGDETGVRLGELFHDGRHGDPLQAQAAVLLGNFQAVVAQLRGLGIDFLGPLAGDIIFLALFLDFLFAEFPDAVQQVLIFGID